MPSILCTLSRPCVITVQFKCSYLGRLHKQLFFLIETAVHTTLRHWKRGPHMTPQSWDSFSFLEEPLRKQIRGAYEEANLTLKDEAKTWPVLCHVDQSSGCLKVTQKL